MKSGNNKKKVSANGRKEMMRIGISTDFGWFELKVKLNAALSAIGYELADIGAYELVTETDYPDFVVPLVIADLRGEGIQRSICGSGVEACTAMNKIPGVCAALITKPLGSSKEAEKEDLYVRCLGGQIKGYAISKKKIMTFLNADHSTSIPSNQRIAKVRVLEREMKSI